MIDERALVSPQADLAPDVEVGPFSLIGADVEIGAGSRIGSHVVIEGPCRIGRDNRIFHFCSIGCEPQDKKYRGERALLLIGDRNTIREYCSINRGTQDGGGVTRIGDDNWIMAYVHIAHDCQIGNDIVMANNVTLAGHVLVEDHALLGGFTKAHQFCRVGMHSLCAMDAGLSQDVPPYVVAAGHLAAPRGINTEGLRRKGFSAAQLRALRSAYRILYRSEMKLADALARLDELAADHPEVVPLVQFVRASERGIIR